MGPETALTILNLDDRMVQLSLTGGTLHVRLRSLGDGESFEVDTPNAAISLLRSGEYLFFVDGDRGQTTVTVRGGDAEVTEGGRAFTLRSRESAWLAGADDNFSSQIDRAPFADGFEIWCQDRDHREEQSQSVRHVSRETIGYEDLDANGSWSEVPDYGWAWAPRVNAGWAPYRDGRWAWVEPWGWTWVDDAPWGFAPFHYGRWANVRGAWFWVPGAMVARPVYAPALVAFVGGPRFGMSISIGGGSGVAWFPLGPREVYRPAYRTSEVYVRQVNVTQVNVTNINVTNVNVNNVRYVNQNAGSVTAVSRDAFVGARQVRTSQVAVPADVISQGRVFGSTANVAPERSSVVMGRPQGMNAVPPSRFEGRAVVVRTAPPPPPVSFAARRDALQANPGRPLDPRAAEALRPTERSRAPLIRQAPPATPASPVNQPQSMPRRDPRMQDRQPVQRPIDRSQPQTPDQPRRDPRMQDQQPVQRPQAPDQPRRDPRMQDQQPVQRPIDRPQPQNVEQPRTDPRSNANPQPRPERQQEKTKAPAKSEDKKDERKQ